MAQKKHKPEEIFAKLRQADVLVSWGRPAAEAIRAIGVTAFTTTSMAVKSSAVKSDQAKLGSDGQLNLDPVLA